jgi:hypothetical protein
MTTTKNTETTVLAHHGIVAGAGQNLADVARDHGVIYACLGCGSILTAPEGMTTEGYRAANPWFSRDLQAEWAECCADEDSVIY